MMSNLQLSILLVIAFNVVADSQENTTVESFISMVLGNLTECGNYQRPINNEALCGIPPSEEDYTYDFGTFDFIIVGAGSAGTLLANRLTEIEQWNVLLLEAGGQENEFSDIPGMALNLLLTDMNWGYLTKPQERACHAMIKNQCTCPTGKVVGGGSTVNGKMYSRGNKEDYDAWEQMGNTGWSYNDVLPYFIKTENSHINNADPGYHGKDGMLDVSYIEPTIFTSIIVQAKQELGDAVVDYNGKQQLGVSPVQFNINGNKIASGGRAFIDPFLYRTNLNLTTNAFVTRLLIDEETKTALGVEFLKDGRRYTARAEREVILSAGAINTPQILMISGIGPEDELRKIGVQTLVDLPVGRNLHDHPLFVGISFNTNKTVFNESVEVLLERYLNGERPFTAPQDIDTISFINVNHKNSTLPDIQQIFVVPVGLGHYGRKFLNIIPSINTLKEPYDNILLALALLQPKSRGTITLQSNSPMDFPIIDYNYYAVEEDMNTMKKAIKETMRLLETEAFKSINASYLLSLEICKDLEEFSDDYWLCAMKHLTSTSYHPVGTTRMGTSRNDSVVSPMLVVHGMNRLRVVDAGVMPKITSGNINAPTFMIAEKAADIIKKCYSICYDID